MSDLPVDAVEAADRVASVVLSVVKLLVKVTELVRLGLHLGGKVTTKGLGSKIASRIKEKWIPYVSFETDYMKAL